MEPIQSAAWVPSFPRGGTGNQSQERIQGVPTEAVAGCGDRVAEDSDRRQVRRAQTHDLGLAEVGDLSRFEAHDRGSHGIDGDGIGARNDRAQRKASAVSGPFALHGREAIDQADPRLHECSEGNEGVGGFLKPFQSATLGASKPHSARNRP